MTRRVGSALAAAFLFTMIALVYNGFAFCVEYSWRRVISVAQVPGREMIYRQVVIDLGDGWQRRLAIQERLVVVRPGQMACIGCCQVRFRRYEVSVYGLELPGYCWTAILPGMPSGEPKLSATSENTQ